MLIKKDPDLIIPYLEDYSYIKGGHCDSVLFPETEEEISDIMRRASIDGVPITLSAAGTGVTGGRVPFGGQVLSVEKLNRIISIEKLPNGGGTAIVEPGVLLTDFLKDVQRQGFFYPPNPTEKNSFIAGNISTSASGARSFKFGTTRDYVLGLRLVLPDGDIIDLERGRIFAQPGRKVEIPTLSGKILKLTLPAYNMPSVKNAAGYYVKDGMDAIDLFIGHEGTLGVITQAKLRLLKSLTGLLDCYVFFRKEEEVINFVEEARDLSIRNRAALNKINAISIEYFDKYSLDLLRKRHGNIPAYAKGAVYFEQEIDEKTESVIIGAWARLIESHGGSIDDTWFAQTEAEREHLYTVRHDLPDLVNEFIKKHNITKIGTDMAVPHSEIRQMLRHYNETLRSEGLNYLIFGHIGDSHLHVNILPENNAQYERGREIYKSFVKKTVSLGGTASAEHGIGKVKHAYLIEMYGEEAVREMAVLKKSIDKACILGRGNIFPCEFLE